MFSFGHSVRQARGLDAFSVFKNLRQRRHHTGLIRAIRNNFQMRATAGLQREQFQDCTGIGLAAFPAGQLHRGCPVFPGNSGD